MVTSLKPHDGGGQKHMSVEHTTRVCKCPRCSRPLDERNPHLRFHLPQPVLEALPNDEERAARTWGNDVVMMVQDIGAFVRILVPVDLTGGFTVTFGAWLCVHHEALRHAWEVWEEPEYMGLQFHGYLANMLPPWEAETYKKPLDAAPRVPNLLPYATQSPDAALQHILMGEWEHGPVLDALAVYGL
jgi:hypothetical protein